MGVMPLSGDERVPPSAPGGPPTIALLHATYHRPGGVGPLRDAWLGRADRADLVDYIVAMDGDDPAVRDTAGWHRVVGPPSDGTVSAVRNWNAAAAASSADLLVVLADDLFPEPGWDTTLRRMLDGWDPQAVAYAVKITDSPDPDDALLRHPIVSRRFYVTSGLFALRRCWVMAASTASICSIKFSPLRTVWHRPSFWAKSSLATTAAP